MMPLVWALVGGILGALLGVVLAWLVFPGWLWLVSGCGTAVGWWVGLMLAVLREP